MVSTSGLRPDVKIMNIELLLLGTCVLSIKMLTDMFTKEKKLKEAYQATLDLWYY